MDEWHLIQNKEELDKIRPYKNNKLKWRPKYPIIVRFRHEDGGLGGGYIVTETIHVRKDVDLIDFFLGVQATEHSKEMGESIFGDKYKKKKV